MVSAVTPLPPGAEAAYPPGPEEVLVARLADPVQLQPAGEPSPSPLRFFDKRRRANAGAWVFSAAGGRAEILWPNGTQVLLYDNCVAIVGSPSRGEPNLIMRALDRMVLNLSSGDQIQLVGGAQLAADSGPWLVERQLFDILRVKNQSKEAGQVAFREEVFSLAPGETIDLALLSAGGRPIRQAPGQESFDGPGFAVELAGAAKAHAVVGGVRVDVTGEHAISGLGVHLALAPGESATFSGLARGASAAIPAVTSEEPLQDGAELNQDGAADDSEGAHSEGAEKRDA
jgi:hypothetical protein